MSIARSLLSIKNCRCGFGAGCHGILKKYIQELNLQKKMDCIIKTKWKTLCIGSLIPSLHHKEWYFHHGASINTLAWFQLVLNTLSGTARVPYTQTNSIFGTMHPELVWRWAGSAHSSFKGIGLGLGSELGLHCGRDSISLTTVPTAGFSISLG